MSKKNTILTTIIISTLLVLFIVLLLYIIYCYGFYDKKQENIYLEYYNSGKWSEVYKRFEKEESKYINIEQFNKTINLMYNKNELQKIYLNYYQDNKVYPDQETFIKEFFYGYKDITLNDISFKSKDKTTLFKRKKIYIEKIYLKNNKENSSILGIINNIDFEIKENSKIKIDDVYIDCNETICHIDSTFGGLHKIEYFVDDEEYFTILNLTADNTKIDILSIDNTIKTKESLKSTHEISETTYTLSPGIYSLNECYLSYDCPSTRYSYIVLNDDGTCKYYTYLSIDQAGDMYEGTYNIVGNFITMQFDSHTYSVFDYDTKQTTDLKISSNIKYRFKIIDNNIFLNDDYKFTFKG